MAFEIVGLDEMIEATRKAMYASEPGSEAREQLSKELNDLMKVKISEFEAVGEELDREERQRIDDEKLAESKRQRFFSAIVEGLKTAGMILAAGIPALIIAMNRDRQVDKILDYEDDEDGGGIITTKAFNEAMKDH